MKDQVGSGWGGDAVAKLGICQVRTARLGERGLSQAMVLSQAPSLAPTSHLDWDEL